MASKRPPKGFTPLRVTKLGDAERVIADRLDLIAAPFGGRVLTHRYRAEVDGEALVKMSRGTSTDEILATMEASWQPLPKSGIGEEFWISIGMRFLLKEDEEVYRRFKGMNDVATNYQRANRANIAEIFSIAKQIGRGMTKKYRRKAELIYVRLNWNRRNKQPRRG